MATHLIDGGDLFWCDADGYVCPTNARGVFGAGLAKTFATYWPHIVEPYRLACEAEEVEAGDVRCDRLGANPWGHQAVVIMMATKDHWQSDARLDWIEKGCSQLCALARAAPFLFPRRSVAMPAIGCGLGNLAWDEVRGIIVRHFDNPYSPLDVWLFPPGVPAS